MLGISGTWPWWVAGPAIGLFVPLLLIVGNRVFGISSNLRAMCAAVFPARVEHFRYDWRRASKWNLLFVGGVAIGGLLASLWGGQDVAISEETRAALGALGIQDFSGLAPREIFSWRGLMTVRGFVSIVGGGFLVGLGSAYAGGCTSGHAISGLADFQLPSLIAVVGFFAGGLIGTYFLLPMVLG